MGRRRTSPEDYHARVDRRGPNDCWPWTRRLDKDGYPEISIGGRRTRAHRYGWTLAFGPIPDGLSVCHKCDYRACCNPTHWFLGTTAVNVADRNAKGRQMQGDRHWSRAHPERVPRGDQHFARRHPERLARGDRNGARLHPERRPRGERNGCAKLIDAEIPFIRHWASTHSNIVIAEAFSVSRGTISRILRGELWQHVGAA